MNGRNHVLFPLLVASVAGCGRSSPPLPDPCPPGMAFVSGGAFLTGAQPDELDLAPLGVKLGFVPNPPTYVEVGDFCMDRFEFPGQDGVKPRASITFLDAQAECMKLGKRLCTELEFDRACGGLDAWHQPYGDDYRPGRCNNEVDNDVGNDRWLVPSGDFAGCVSPEGIYDLDGNLSEWVEPSIPIDWPPGAQDALPPAPADELLDDSGEEGMGAVRGGTMWVAIYGSGCHARHLHPIYGPTSNDDGFRCCADVPRPPPPPQTDKDRR